MKKSKLIVLLSTFNTAEWRRFGEYINSPFFNKKEELVLFYHYLRKIAPDFKEKNLEKEVIFKKVFPEMSFNNRFLVHLNSSLLKLAEQFLAQMELEEMAQFENILTLEQLTKRKLEKHYRHNLRVLEKAFENRTTPTNDYYFYQYKISDIAQRYFLTLNQRKYDPCLQVAFDNLDQYYFINKLKATCELLEWQNIIAADYEFTFTEEVVAHLEKMGNQSNPIIAIYLTIYYLLTKEDTTEDFVSLQRLLKENNSIIPDIDKKAFYLFAINYCGQQIKQNNQIYYYAEQCLNLYKEGIEQKFLYVNDYLSPWTFKNVVKLGTNLKKYDWTEAFIQQYHTQLEIAFQEDALHFNLAELYYLKEDFAKAQSHLMQVQFSDIFYNLGAKTMLLKIYFETDEEEPLLSLLAAFTIYLKRNKKVANNIRQTYLNFTSLLYQLVKAKPHKLLKIKEQITQIELLTDRRWLLKACESIEKVVG